QEAITSCERQRVRNALDAEPAVAARNHSEMGEMEWRTRGLSRISCGPLRDICISPQPPGGSGFQPCVNHARDPHGLKQIGNRVQLWPPIWTLRQVKWTKGQFESIVMDIYSSSLDEFCGRGGSDEAASNRFQRADQFPDSTID